MNSLIYPGFCPPPPEVAPLYCSCPYCKTSFLTQDRWRGVTNSSDGYANFIMQGPRGEVRKPIGCPTCGGIFFELDRRL